MRQQGRKVPPFHIEKFGQVVTLFKILALVTIDGGDKLGDILGGKLGEKKDR